MLLLWLEIQILSKIFKYLMLLSFIFNLNTTSGRCRARAKAWSMQTWDSDDDDDDSSTYYEKPYCVELETLNQYSDFFSDELQNTERSRLKFFHMQEVIQKILTG